MTPALSHIVYIVTIIIHFMSGTSQVFLDGPSPIAILLRSLASTVYFENIVMPPAGFKIFICKFCMFLIVQTLNWSAHSGVNLRTLGYLFYISLYLCIFTLAVFLNRFLNP